VSNEEFQPLPQAPAQAQVERLMAVLAEMASRETGLNRRDVLKTPGGIAGSAAGTQLSLRQGSRCLGWELVEAAASTERNEPSPCIFEVLTDRMPWVSECCRVKRQESALSNLCREIGSTFAQLVTVQPMVCAHLLGQLIQAFGEDQVVWETDAIWYGLPQWQMRPFGISRFPRRCRSDSGILLCRRR
jgi:hypothetical protein